MYPGKQTSPHWSLPTYTKRNRNVEILKRTPERHHEPEKSIPSMSCTRDADEKLLRRGCVQSVVKGTTQNEQNVLNGGCLGD